MKTISIQSVPPTQQRLAIQALTRAFLDDPIVRWLFPEKDYYLRTFPKFAAAYAGRAFEHAAAFSSDGFTGTACWLPPGVEPDHAKIEAALDQWVTKKRRAEAAPVFELMDHFHPKEPHWYLPLLGVAPTHQNRGLGSALLQHTLERCDQEGMPAYLESSNRVNLPLYERHGFVQIGEIQSGNSPTLFPMTRRPRSVQF